MTVLTREKKIQLLQDKILPLSRPKLRGFKDGNFFRGNEFQP